MKILLLFCLSLLVYGILKDSDDDPQSCGNNCEYKVYSTGILEINVYGSIEKNYSNDNFITIKWK